MSEPLAKVRIDKWLWAARFFKTRNLAIKAVNGGKIHLNKQRVKPAKAVQVDDYLTINIGYTERTVQVTALSDRRGSAPQASLLYQETAESIEKREQATQLYRATHAQREAGSGRPTKKQRRHVSRFIKIKTTTFGN